MSRSLYNLYGVFGLVPIWIFRSNFNIKEITIILIFFYFIPLIFHIFIGKFLHKNDKTKSLYISIIFFYSIDNNIGLWVLADKLPFFFYSYYLHAMIISLAIILISSLILIYEKKNFSKVFFVFLITVLIFNVFNFDKNPSNFPKKEIKDPKDLNNKTKEFVLILDEMSGIESVDSYNENGVATKEYLLKILKKNNFDIFTNSYSDYGKTLHSIPTALNGIIDRKKYLSNLSNQKPYEFLTKSNNYFIVWNLNKNEFFDKYVDKNIIVFQSMFINFCKHPSVVRCYQYNPFKKYEKYIDGFNYNLPGRVISYYKNNLSITGNTFWRMVRHFKLADSILDPEGEKAIFPTLIDQIQKEILDTKNNLVFAHLLIPHVPNVFDEKCRYSRDRGIYYNFSSREEKIYQHNLERKCTFVFLDQLFSSLKEKKIFDSVKIVIFSDHDSRIEKREINSVLFAIKKINSQKSNIIKETISSQSIFKKEILN